MCWHWIWNEYKSQENLLTDGCSGRSECYQMRTAYYDTVSRFFCFYGDLDYKNINMEKTDWSIISQYWEWTRQDFLFTYSEEERQEIRFNQMIVEQEIKWYSYFIVYEQQLVLWFSEPEAMLFNFVDWYTQAWKLFRYSISQICKKTHRWKDKVINTIKSLKDKWYIIEHPWKDKFWQKRRFLSSTTKYSLELLKLRGWSENQIEVVGKSDRGWSENPTHSNIYSNINNIYMSSDWKKTDISPVDTYDIREKEKEKSCGKREKEINWYSKDFEECWKRYPAPSWRGSKKDSYKKWLSWNDEDIELIKKKVLEECVNVNSWKKDKKRVCSFEKYMENNRWVDVNIEWLVNDYMKCSWDIKKKWIELLKEYFWEEEVKKYVFRFIRDNETFKLDLH